MAKRYTLHPDSPQPRSIDQIRQQLRQGAVMLYPTDTVYAIGCDLQSKDAIQRVRQIKQLSNDKPLTFLCASLSNIAAYATVSDTAYRMMRRLIPGPYTFILPATKLVPKLVMSPKRKTTGIRVPDHAVCQALLTSLDNPIISASANVVDDEMTSTERDTDGQQYWSRFELFDALENQVDLIIDNGDEPNSQTSTIIDLTEDDEPTVLRKGLGYDVIQDLLD